jgi:hypothetical protein
MIYLIAAQPPPSAQDFSDLEQALIGSESEGDVQAKVESIKAALQWVKRCGNLISTLRECCCRCAALRVSAFVHDPSVSLRRDAKHASAPASSLAKAGSILTKAVGNLVGGSSGSPITQVCKASSSKYCSSMLTHVKVMNPLLEKGPWPAGTPCQSTQLM